MKKSSFGAIFLEKFTKTEQIKKKIGFQLANYWVFNKLAWVFGRKLLEFFRDPPWVIFEMSKKSLLYYVSIRKTLWPFSSWRWKLTWEPRTWPSELWLETSHLPVRLLDSGRGRWRQSACKRWQGRWLAGHPGQIGWRKPSEIEE